MAVIYASPSPSYYTTNRDTPTALTDASLFESHDIRQNQALY